MGRCHRGSSPRARSLGEPVIPAPDAFRCTATHPDSTLVRCFLVAHGPETDHVNEAPSPSPTYHATHVRRWRDDGVPCPRPSEFAEGPFHDTPARHRHDPSMA